MQVQAKGVAGSVGASSGAGSKQSPSERFDNLQVAREAAAAGKELGWTPETTEAVTSSIVSGQTAGEQITGGTTASVGSPVSRDPEFETEWARAHPEGHVEMGVVGGKGRSDILVLWNFGVGSADVAKFTGQLARHIPMLTGWTDLGDQILIEGATSTSGSEERNLTLGLARALAVKRWLVSEAKLPAAQILTETLGEGGRLPGLPVLDGEVAARNRRVEMRRIALNWEDTALDNYQRALKLVSQSQFPPQQKKRLMGLLTHLSNPHADDLYFNRDALLWVRQFLGRPGYEWLESPSRWAQGEPPILAHMRDRFAALHPRSSDSVVVGAMQTIDFVTIQVPVARGRVVGSAARR
jgi:outer membrane protein OmpA-like peptidoglycan-associated protein